jgi:4-hydroxyphenylpyruvate dioxygenase
VILYRQGAIQLIINAHRDDARVSALAHGAPVLSAVAFRVQDAQQAWDHCTALGAWPVPAHAQAMELNVPAIHGPGNTRLYFVDRHREFSIFDIDFVAIPGVEQTPPALMPLTLFGVVQYIGQGRSAAWIAFYRALLGFSIIPPQQRFGTLPKGQVLASPGQHFMWQLIEPDAQTEAPPGLDAETELAQQTATLRTDEALQRIALAVDDVPAAVRLLSERGLQFLHTAGIDPLKGAITRPMLGSVCFELVRNPSAV